MAASDTGDLEARIARLEAENAALRADQEAAGVEPASAPPRVRRRRGRTIASVAMIVVGLLLAPVAVLSAWARLELVDTDRFVATFGPLAEQPAVQAYLGDQVTAAIEEQVDIPGLTADLFDGLATLDLPPRAAAALGLLEAPATQGLQNLVANVVDRVIQSPAFADVWSTALRVSHQQAIAAIQGDPSAALAIGGDGAISVQLGPIVQAVKDRLIEQGVGFASAIPEVDRSIVIAQDDSFALIKTVYALAVAVGTWLPWITLALLIAGVLVAKRRSVALVWTAGGFALVMALFASGIGIGRTFFIGTVSPSIMPADTAEVVYDGLLEIMARTIIALLVLGAFIAIIAWFSGPWRPARASRELAESGFTSVRSAAARRGLTTGSFGVWLDRWRGAVYAAIAVIASLAVLFVRPATAGTVFGIVVVALIALLLVELLRRPVAEVAAGAAEAPGEAGPVGSEVLEPEHEASVAAQTVDGAVGGAPARPAP